MGPRQWESVDPFELPDWLGADDVTWSAECALGRPTVPGVLRSDDGSGELACDFLAADVACPAPLVDEPTRTRIHQAWRDGQVELLSDGERLTLGVPGTAQDAGLVLEAIGRFAHAVGTSPAHYGVRLRAGH
ncbi:MAG TPA: hypothetical protein VJ872_12720 [Nocardioides sp.]|nr:hypothetical protein [Nocardioides sp.]